MEDAALWLRAAEAIQQAEALLITAGAGLGVDSGLPDFRGPEGFWNAYPPYRKLGLRFVELANPRWFRSDPKLAWGFYGHRLELYRRTAPHAGFMVLRRWAETKPAGWFVFTSNVDGHFQKAGFDPQRIVEIHGSIHHLQCMHGCGSSIFPADGIRVTVEESTMRAVEPLPSCPSCGRLARPNVLMFGDGEWDPERTAAQEHGLERWLATLDGCRLVVVEIGAGQAVPTVRRFSETAAAMMNGVLIRINPREPEGADIPLARGALEALRRLDTLLAGTSARSDMGMSSSVAPEEQGEIGKAEAFG